MRFLLLVMTLCAIWPTAGCRRTVVVDRPVRVLVPVEVPREACLPPRPVPARPADLFAACTPPTAGVACLSRPALEALVAYLLDVEAWASHAEIACGTSPQPSAP